MREKRAGKSRNPSHSTLHQTTRLGRQVKCCYKMFFRNRRHRWASSKWWSEVNVGYNTHSRKCLDLLPPSRPLFSRLLNDSTHSRRHLNSSTNHNCNIKVKINSVRWITCAKQHPIDRQHLSSHTQQPAAKKVAKDDSSLLHVIITFVVFFSVLRFISFKIHRKWIRRLNFSLSPLFAFLLFDA